MSEAAGVVEGLETGKAATAMATDTETDKAVTVMETDTVTDKAVTDTVTGETTHLSKESGAAEEQVVLIAQETDMKAGTALADHEEGMGLAAVVVTTTRQSEAELLLNASA